MALDSKQNALLVAMVDAFRSTPRRQSFHCFGVETSHDYVVSHPGISKDFEGAYPGDLSVLQAEGLITSTATGRRQLSVDLTPKGIEYASLLRQRTVDPITHVEESIMTLLSPGILNTRYPAATQKWEEARQVLWSKNAMDHLSTIGHLCRECLQEFAFALAQQKGIQVDRKDIAQTVTTIKSVLGSSTIGAADKPFLKALLDYWGTLSDLVQRQEHAGAKEGRPVSLADAKRVVFHTALVMYEFDQVAAERG